MLRRIVSLLQDLIILNRAVITRRDDQFGVVRVRVIVRQEALFILDLVARNKLLILDSLTAVGVQRFLHERNEDVPLEGVR